MGLRKNARAKLILSDVVRLLKAIRLEKKMSHDALAEKIGISRPCISYIESGKRLPSMLMMIKISQGMGVELSSVLNEAEKNHPPDRH